MFLSAEKEQNIKNTLQPFLEQVVQNKSQHTRWLNTLAFMEYIGARKIIKSQKASTLNHTVLQHISEEARHAFYFKNLAHKLSPADCSDFHETRLIKGAESEDYFQAIDHKAEEELSHSPAKNTLNYLYTTWLIEERAVMLYKLYNNILKKNQQPFNLNFILQEEDHHLKTVVELIQKKDPNFKERALRLFNYEQTQFATLIKQWQSLETYK